MRMAGRAASGSSWGRVRSMDDPTGHNLSSRVVVYKRFAGCREAAARYLATFPSPTFTVERCRMRTAMVDSEQIDRGEPKGEPREKFTRVEELLSAAATKAHKAL